MSSGGNCTRRLSWDLIPVFATITPGAVEKDEYLLVAGGRVELPLGSV